VKQEPAGTKTKKRSVAKAPAYDRLEYDKMKENIKVKKEEDGCIEAEQP
jgi:hypothetical protein